MSTADKIDDSWPHTHGTVEGYDHGCRGGSCPAGDEYGLSCKLAKSLSRNDYRYGRLVKAGSTVAEIAAEFDLVGTSTPPASKPKAAAKRKPAQPVPTAPVAAPAPEPAAAADVVEPARVTPESEAPAPTVPTPPSAQEVRQWARDRGYDLPSFGRIPKHIRAHYDEAHADGAFTPDGAVAIEEKDALAVAREIREFVGPILHEDGRLNASAIAQESTLRTQAGIPGWIAELDAPRTDRAEDIEPEPITPAPTEQSQRPEWGHVALQEDLERASASATIALEERDRGRALAARLFDELHRAETTATEHRERSAAALADYLRDLADAERARDIAEQALAAEAEGRRIAESALQLTLQKWGQLKAVEGGPSDAQVEAAARAIFEVRDDEFDVRTWDDLDSYQRERYECDARAALRAAGSAR